MLGQRRDHIAANPAVVGTGVFLAAGEALEFGADGIPGQRVPTELAAHFRIAFLDFVKFQKPGLLRWYVQMRQPKLIHHAERHVILAQPAHQPQGVLLSAPVGPDVHHIRAAHSA